MSIIPAEERAAQEASRVLAASLGRGHEIEYEAELSETERLHYLRNLCMCSVFLPVLGVLEAVERAKLVLSLGDQYAEHPMWDEYAALRGNFREGRVFDC